MLLRHTLMPDTCLVSQLPVSTSERDSSILVLVISMENTVLLKQASCSLCQKLLAANSTHCHDCESRPPRITSLFLMESKEKFE